MDKLVRLGNAKGWAPEMAFPFWLAVLRDEIEGRIQVVCSIEELVSILQKISKIHKRDIGFDPGDIRVHLWRPDRPGDESQSLLKACEEQKAAAVSAKAKDFPPLKIEYSVEESSIWRRGRRGGWRDSPQGFWRDP